MAPSIPGLIKIFPYFPSVFQGVNARQDVVFRPLPFYYASWFPLQVFLTGQLISYLDTLLLGGVINAPITTVCNTITFIVLIMWSRVCVFSHSLWPTALQSTHVAANRRWDDLMDLRTDTSKYLEIVDPALSHYKTHKIPLLLFFEEYKKGHINIKVDLEVMLREKDEWSVVILTWEYLHFIVFGYFADIIWHDKDQDHGQVTEHYNTGNDLFGWFLGPRMLYTSGYFLSGDEPLEQAQDNKLELVCKKIGLEKGMTLLDLGCGWGTWALYTAGKFGAKTSALSIAKEQIAFAKERAAKNNIKGIEWLCMDYRDMPLDRKFERITCFEMSEHVGIKRYPEFLALVREALADDGIFYLQIAGLRELWQHEDVSWGIFMYRYIFRGADASLPLNWVANQLECAGFEIHSVETIGVHYAYTIKRWYDNWMKNKDKAIKTYGREIFRVYEYFLAHSAIIPEKGSSTCFQIVCHKNLDDFDRTRFYGEGNRIFPLSEKPFDL
eukprot:CAMPEP_0170735818 /NCGR_PEP_ID=MMETSP0437-20130122/3290_1 /TAXON_ID=0 /ORGANISM="Sexangularia sp." /LENGTH=496 /DNA_ID=CAMNT_0011074151 /DNA_START=135 /DNA_END=1621 /DNA_ORIENTATION=+